ncbi:alpha/beta fold hydrolase [Lolliginicoccus levis]|uniref:alpha/beta fold hydrolase n=1 Tax=Lolliginicoccus levis TaxID=2919542 RepID=UPI00241D55B4|nr:alpha/beta fold hydrolase [Lolliginicoccus levis]
MAKKIGAFKDDESREAYLHAYTALEAWWPVPALERTVETSFGPTHVRISGSGAGTPVVLLHPILGNGLIWHQSIEGLARDREVYALDTIGTAGRSVQTAPITSEADFAIWFDELLAGLGLDSVHLVGYSDGGRHATAIAIRDPRRLASLTLIEPGNVLDKVSWRILAKMIAVGARPTDENFRKFREWFTPGVHLNEEELALLKVAAKFRTKLPWGKMPTDEQLRSIPAPVLVILGSETLLVNVERAVARALGAFRSAEVEVYQGAAHGVLHERPAEVIGRILQFVRKHDR